MPSASAPPPPALPRLATRGGDGGLLASGRGGARWCGPGTAACQGAASDPDRKRAYRLPGRRHVVFVSQESNLVHAPTVREARNPCLRDRCPENFAVLSA